MAAAAVGILIMAAVAIGVAMSMVIMPVMVMGTAKLHLVVAAALDGVVVVSSSEASSRRIDSSSVDRLDVSNRRFARLRVTARLGPSTLKDAAADATGRLKVGAVLVKGLCKMGAACRGLMMSVGVMGVFMVVVCVTYILQASLRLCKPECLTLHRNVSESLLGPKDDARRTRRPMPRKGWVGKDLHTSVGLAGLFTLKGGSGSDAFF